MNNSVSSSSAQQAQARMQAEKSLTAPRIKRIDSATILGVSGGFVMIIGAMILGGNLGSFFNIPSVLIVIGGTFLVTTISYSLPDVAQAQSTMFTAVAYHTQSPSRAAAQCIFLADTARRQGMLALQKYAQNKSGNRLLDQGMVMLQDGYNPEELGDILMQQVHAAHQQKKNSASILRRSGEVAPAMGLIGTLVGLVQMLSNLEDPSSIGPAMAVALLTTFYGAVLANMIFHPLAAKLERLAEDDMLVDQIYCTGLEAICRQENPRRLETVFNTLLPANDPVRYYN